MSDNTDITNEPNGNEVQTFTKEDVEKLLSEREIAIKTEFQKHISKLNDENKNKRLENKEFKAMLADMLGLTPETPAEKDIIAEKVASLTKNLEDMQSQLKTKDEEIAKTQKQTAIKEQAMKLGFADPTDVLAFINLDSENIESDLKQLAETKPYLLGKKPNVGGGTPPAIKPTQKTGDSTLDMFINLPFYNK